MIQDGGKQTTNVTFGNVNVVYGHILLTFSTDICTIFTSGNNVQETTKV
jgi:hypothetical protein